MGRCEACNAMVLGSKSLCPECLEVSNYELAQVPSEIEFRREKVVLNREELENYFVDKVARYDLLSSWADGLNLEKAETRADRLTLIYFAKFLDGVSEGRPLIDAFKEATGLNLRGTIEIN